MKKLLIAAALTASVCSFGANINAQKFDDATVGAKPADIEEVSGEDAVKYFKADGGDASAVAAYGGDNPTASEKTTTAGSAGANYLNLSTEGSTLWRTINPYTFETSTTTDENGKEETTVTETTATKVAAATGTYIDTLVQFTATEEDPTSIDTGAKLAMWLLKTGEGEDATYKLKVAGATITLNEENYETAQEATYEMDVSVVPSAWYRLTVKAVRIFEDSEATYTYGMNGYGFAIYLDGNLIKPKTTAVSSEVIDAIKAYLSVDVKAMLMENMLIPSATFLDASEDLYGVGFKGTGAIDSIAWTDDDLYPFSAPSAAFTLTIAMDEDSIDSVTYTFGEGDAAVTATVTADTADIEVPANAVVKFTAVAKDWFTAPTIADITMTANTTTDEIKGVAVTASDITFADTTVPADAATAALAWAKNAGKTTDQVKAAKYFYSDYLLGFTDFSQAEPTIEIVSIEFDDDGKPVVEAKVTVDGVTKIEKLSTATLNGTLKYKAAATLELLKTAKSKTAIEDGDQFIQVVVE